MDAFGLALSEQSEQGSQQWSDVRAGRFTASEIFKLMDSGTRMMNAAELKARPKEGKGKSAKMIEDPNLLSKPAITYINEKVAETLTGQAKPQVFSRATEWGDQFEPLAAEEFKKETGLDFEIISFVTFGDHAGGSPDRIIKGTGDILEIKCPYNSENQVAYLLLTDQWDLKRMHPNHYWQCMSNLLFSQGAAKMCHFVTYDYRMIEKKNQFCYIPIKPIEEDFDLIIKKLEVAVAEKLRALQIIRNQKPTLVIK